MKPGTAKRIDEERRHWYGEHLASMDEPSLSCKRASAVPVFRFLWVRSFHAPWGVRIEKIGGTVIVSAIKTSGKGAVGKPVERYSIKRDVAAWERLLSALNHADYWHLDPMGGSEVFDGAEWVVEGLLDGNYQVTSQTSPKPGSYRDLGLLFLELANLDGEKPLY